MLWLKIVRIFRALLCPQTHRPGSLFPSLHNEPLPALKKPALTYGRLRHMLFFTVVVKRDTFIVVHLTATHR